MSTKKLFYYHNPRCSKSREGLKLLESSGKKFEIKEYLKTGLTKSEVEHILKTLDQEPLALVRTKETLFKSLSLKPTDLTSSKIVSLLLNHPELLERPLLCSEKLCLIGRPPEKLLEILK